MTSLHIKRLIDSGAITVCRPRGWLRRITPYFEQPQEVRMPMSKLDVFLTGLALCVPGAVVLFWAAGL